MTPLTTDTTEHQQHPMRGRAFQVALSCLLSAASSAPYALGVFTPSVTAAHNSLGSIWPSAAGLPILLNAPTMVASGLLLTRFRASRLHVARGLALASTCGFALFTAAGPAVRAERIFVVRAAVAALGVPLGVLTLLTLEHSVAWLPGRPGVAVALSSLSFNSGTVVVAFLFVNLQKILSVEYALSVAACVLASCGLLYFMFLSFPFPSPVRNEKKCVGSLTADDGIHLQPIGSMESLNEQLVLLGETDRPESLSWRTAICNVHFWLYTVCALTVGAGFALFPYFFRLGALFGAEGADIDRAFQLGGLIGIPIAPIVATIAPMLRSKHGWGCKLRLGARNVWIFVLLTQAAICVRLAGLHGNPSEFSEFAMLAGLLRGFYMVQNSLAALLAREIFGRDNTAFVYGVGAGFALGAGEAASVAIMAAVESAGGSLRSVKQCAPFYFAIASWSAIVLGLMTLIRRQGGVKHALQTNISVW